jgi:succinyl-diaminopimelate desuccinylase
MTRHSLLHQIDETEVVSLCRNLVQFKSVNPPGDEREIAEFVARYLREAGLMVEIVAHTPTRASLVARLKGSGAMTALIYCGHLDVVPAGDAEWEHDPFGGEVVDRKLWGRGSSDMKSGVAAMMIAAKLLAAARLPLTGDLVLALTSDEEVDGLGAIVLADRRDLTPAQALVIPESTSNGICVAEKGQLWLRLTTFGTATHGSTPHLGRNAITMMVALLSELEQLKTSHEPHPLLGGYTRSIGTIQGGLSTNIVPERCVVTVDQRTVPGQDHATVVNQVRTLVNDLGERMPGFQASVEIISDLPPVATPANHPAVQRFGDIVAAVTGERSDPRGVPYATDAASLAPTLNVPLIICGPGDPSSAHQPDEYVEIDRLVDATKILTLAAVEFLT